MKPVMIFDGDCNFCRRWISRWRQATGDRVEYVAFQEPGLFERFPNLRREDCEQAVQLIDADGRIHSAAEAVFRTLAFAPRRHWTLWLYQEVPGVKPVTEWFYRYVARHRTGFSHLTRFFWGRHVEVPTHYLTRWVFLRLLGLVYLIAFVSLGTQVDGLIGSNGITPAAALMTAVRDGSLGHNGWAAYWLAPTLCWFSSSNAALHALCWGGALLSLLVIVGVATPLALFGCWLFYLSLSVVCDVFLSFQWDMLLLETGFLAIFFAPFQLVPRLARESPPSRLWLWLFRWLLFRLMLSSGVVKLASGDPLWHNLTALTVHYETQPLPTWIGWYAHQLPVWFQKTSCAIMFGVELGVPFLVFGPRRSRFVAAWVFVAFMGLIALTGNYCFFNLLTALLCVLLLDDAALLEWCRGSPFGRMKRRLSDALAAVLRRGAAAPRWRFWTTLPVAIGILLVSVVQQFRVCRLHVRWPRPIRIAYMDTYQSIAPFRSVNTYGLFAVMTSVRNEIIVEGSNDGLTWRPYEFRYKPGNPSARPRFVEPFQPRLDWQMWFAALGDYRTNPWFIDFCIRLLQGSPQVLALLGQNPFPGEPPRYIRAMVYRYHFTDFATRRKTGQWWHREFIGPYCPILSLRQ
ncbi:MAG TPA: lipase maturation factor family protein [Verrucomicrobiae bacterium]|nr:lipase maturation factor family protein [Verrucomicrobiae bacterium]